jgi:FkbM family methyltransferase
MEYIIHPEIQCPIGVRIDGVDGKNDGDLAIFNIVLSQTATDKPAPNSICVDVGADKGWFSRLMQKVIPENLVVYAFEPNPTSYRELVDGLARDGKKSIYAFPIAISSQETTLDFVFDGPCSHSRGAAGDQRAERVFAKPLDSVIEAGRQIYFMKIDTEGHDLDVLASARGLIEAGCVRHIVFEYTSYWLGTLAEATVKTRAALETYMRTYKYIYSLSRCGPTYLVGPLAASEIDAFVEDHYTRHLQTDIYMTNVAPTDIPTFPFKAGTYYA